jgi:hypothetical protein
MHMNDAFAGAVTVSIPIFALAAGAEARSIRDRLRRPDEKWEKEFARYREEHDLDLDGSAMARPQATQGWRPSRSCR